MSVPVAVPLSDYDGNDPVTFHRVMQVMIGEELKARYEPPKKLSHELFVLMLQLKEEERRGKAAKPRVKAGAASSNVRLRVSRSKTQTLRT